MQAAALVLQSHVRGFLARLKFKQVVEGASKLLEVSAHNAPMHLSHSCTRMH
jgi:IQ calmodulin-binding motif